MHVDTTALMYGVFQDCRLLSRRIPESLELLAEVLELVRQQGTFVVDVPECWVAERGLDCLVVGPEQAVRPENAVRAANERLLAFIEVGTRELTMLWAAGAKRAVHVLGYVFHMLPDLLPRPEDFSPGLYMFCVRMAGHHWSELSPAMRQAFCELLGLDRRTASALADATTFPLHGWRLQLAWWLSRARVRRGGRGRATM